jgi:hypothetical protein
MLGFCEKCRNREEYSIKEESKVKTIKGKIIKYIGKEAYCNRCGSNIFVHEIRDYNLKILEKEYRKLD